MIAFLDDSGVPWVGFSFSKSGSRYAGHFSCMSLRRFELLTFCVRILKFLVSVFLALSLLCLGLIWLFYGSDKDLYLTFMVFFGGVSLSFFVIFYLFVAIGLSLSRQKFYSKWLRCERAVSLDVQLVMLLASLLLQIVGLARHVFESGPHSFFPDIAMFFLLLYFLWRYLLVIRISTGTGSEMAELH
jgi:hypothetical protein